MPSGAAAHAVTTHTCLVCFLGNIVQTFAGSIHLGRRRHDSGAIHHEAMDEKAKTRPVFVGSNLEDEKHHSNSVTLRFNDLVCDAMMCADRGTLSAGSFKVVKEVLLRAFREIDKQTNAGRQQVGNI